ncbi:MAG TPA: hypothetical protein VHF01_04595, partial [Candidatus Acidoferrum sp.]|nr:hypothetical protein [Candidatus Acidoferrum sp.]
QEVWLKALAVERVSDSKEVFSGSGTIGGSRVQFKVTVDVPADVKAVKLTYDFRSEKELPGRQAVLAYHSDFAHTWQCHIYPYAESSKYVERDPLSYMGIPSLFLYRDDRTMGLFWGIDMNFD